MLLFSSLLNINNTMTRENFIDLVLRWNRESKWEENIIPGIVWNGETNIRYGNDSLWLSIEEYVPENIIAVRFEKVEEDGIIWDTDYIMNFNDMKMSVRLDRSYTEDALSFDPDFSTPYFIKYLIDEGFLQNDEGLPVTHTPIMIRQDNVKLLTDLISFHKAYGFPVVYVSKTSENTDPVDINLLAFKLKGIAHVMVEEDANLDSVIAQDCDHLNEYNGAIGIYYPNFFRGNDRILYRRYHDSDRIMLQKVIRAVVQFSNIISLGSHYTYQGVKNAMLLDRLKGQTVRRLEAEKAKSEAEKARSEAEDARIKAENETQNVYDAFDEDLEKLQSQIEALARENEALRNENHGIRTKLDGMNQIPVLIQGEETEFYLGEIREIVLSELETALEKLPEKSRRADIIRDIIENNDYQHLQSDRDQRIKTLLKDYKSLSAPARQELIDLGFEITEDGKHYKLTYYGDDRYWVTLSKTSSDHRSGKNLASEIKKGML